MEKNMIGKILEDGTIVKDYGNGGFKYFLDMNAFNNKKGICYVSEKDYEYDYDSIIALTNGNIELAKHYLDITTGTSLELLLEEDLNNDEVHLCTNCDNYYFSYEKTHCPLCNQTKDNK